MVEGLAERLRRKDLGLEGPARGLLTDCSHSSSAFCSGWDGGTQCDSFSSKVLSAHAPAALGLSSPGRTRRKLRATRTCAGSPRSFLRLPKKLRRHRCWSALVSPAFSP